MDRRCLGQLLAFPAVASAAIGSDTYTGAGAHVPRNTGHHGYAVGCHVCGAVHRTLYRDSSGMICDDCRKSNVSETTT